MKFKNLLNTAIVTGIAAILIFPPSCANTSTPPEGGPKDTLAPILVEVVPPINSLHHPVDIKHSTVSFEFDEYVVLNNPNSYIFLSPPQSKPPTAKIKGKKVVVSFTEPWIPARPIPCPWERLSRTITRAIHFLLIPTVSLPEVMWIPYSCPAIS